MLNYISVELLMKPFGFCATNHSLYSVVYTTQRPWWPYRNMIPGSNIIDLYIYIHNATASWHIHIICDTIDKVLCNMIYLSLQLERLWYVPLPLDNTVVTSALFVSGLLWCNIYLSYFWIEEWCFDLFLVIILQAFMIFTRLDLWTEGKYTVIDTQ